MKKLLLAFAIGTASLVGFTGCTKEYITNYLPGISYVAEVNPQNWSRTGNEFATTINMPELDEKYFQDGHVDISISFDSKPEVYENIPSEIGNYKYSANYGVGKVNIYAVYIGSGAPVAPEGSLVKIVLTDADNGDQ
ncbi:hypothetical protein GQF61_17485 [Sphingobacterium sp. DK4209]|uniref:Uncharacterized protein n=1 Tax=Sphingobacterium zhuxiongii TaxID=2662364 RepID=A0A5Q0QD10_9SPHI|nr:MULTISPECIES: hypothetical protein [unclassified Sphingobacterium]MVZ67642.1 hypothetical protein [Sphingobacterium sp. DK4209]QGA27204.1 hypothetical protein GFH32_13190 [Sphingobacterium sp. dk4302]